MKNFRLRLQAMCIALVLGIVSMSAQEIRYVKVNGAGAKNGSDWDNAYANIQDAINDLVNNNKMGEVWVAAGDYYPTETTEASNSPYYKSFKIPAGITVRGGFKGDETSRDQRVTVADKNFGAAMGRNDVPTRDLDGEKTKSGVYTNKTILHGDIDQSKKAEMNWNPTKQQFDAVFYGNSYHVVWFAMNGFNSETKRANPLAKPAKLEGCVIEGGHAYTRDANSPHPHIGYGGGIYMVANSFVYNCEVRNCDASRNGGGIYMDGGGIVRRTLVHDCQALGLGTDFGFGGGICENGGALTNKTNPVVVAQSVVTNCVGRMGGGMALLADETAKANKDHKYAIVANSTLVNNNTAQIEAGGVYTHGGGGLASMTIVRNKCNGSGITQNGQITGRSGGVYSRDASYIGNTVIWGNECEANKDMQYADSRTSLQDNEKTRFYYSALSNADIADWSKSEKMGVLSLDSVNTTTVANKGNKGYPLFENPTTKAGYFATSLTGDFDWKVFSESALHHAGINTADLDYEGLTPAPQGDSYDMQFGKFNSRCTMGAIVSEEPLIGAKIDTDKKEAHFFVDPNYNFAMHHGTEESKEAKGKNWDLPTRFLGNVLEYIARDRQIDDINKRTLGEVVGDEYNEYTIFIHVKEGTVDNTDSYESGRVRCTSLDIPSNVTILGSYNSQLTGTDLSLRNVVHTPTVISGQLLNSYDYNIAHLININKQHDIIIEDFKISFANANSTELGNTNRDGAAITVVNSEDIMFRNIIVSNCTADHGAAVYADKSTVEFENCIFHNNQTATIDNSGIVYATNGAVLDFNHCDVLRNVGHASYLGSNETKNYWQNSIFYGNLDRPVPDTNTDTEGANTYALAAFSGATANATGAYCMFDAKSASFASRFGGGDVENGGDTGNKWQYNLQYKFADGTGQGYPRFINPTKNSGVTEDGDQTYYGRGVSFEPHNNNPIVNMASHTDLHTSWGTDIVYVTRDFGGLPDIGAVENHVANQYEEGENAYTDGQKPYGDAYYVRDYASGEGTSMDTYDWNSTTKKYEKNTAGKGIYNAAGELLDGASWEYAVNGNGLYTLRGPEYTDANSVFIAKGTEDPSRYTGKFRIMTGTDTYIYVDGANLKTTTDKSKAAIVTVSGSTTSAGVPKVNAGNRNITTVIGDQTYYLYRNGSSANVQTGTAQVNIASVTGGFSITANNRLYLVNTAGSVTTPNNNKNYTTWVFEPEHALIYTETPVKQDGFSELTDAEKKAGVAANATVSDPLNFHVYKSIEDYNNSPAKKTYKIKRKSDNYYLKNNTGTNAAYLYPNASGDNFILIQDGEYGKYYLYDVTTNKYVYYYTGSSTTSRVRMDANTKSTWWIDKSATDGALNIVYGEQPWTTSGSYAITCTTNTGTRVSLAAKTTDNAQLVLVANQAYDVYNYKAEAKAAETLNGLQYAVNLANDKFDADHKEREVKVAKGIYTNASPKDANSVEQPYAYMMKEGVNVYGGFPENGNPGMNERQPKTFITILQPQEKNPLVNATYNSSTYKLVASSWGCAAKNNGSEEVSVGRVLVQSKDFDVQTRWDGFTVRHGYLLTARMKNIGPALSALTPANVMYAGGAGALLRDNGVLTNCEVTENLILCSPGHSGMITTGDHTATKDGNGLYTYHMAGAGIFMNSKFNSSTGVITNDAKGAVVENCQVYNNQILTKSAKKDFSTGSGTSYTPHHAWMYGSGIYQNGGNIYNTIVHDNLAATIEGNVNGSVTGGGEIATADNEMLLGSVFVAKGNFYNNTVVNNLGVTLYGLHNNHCTFSGIHVFDAAYIYNSIISDNISKWGYSGGMSPGNGVPISAFVDNDSKRSSRDQTKVHVFYSFVDVSVGEEGYDLVSFNDNKTTYPDPDNPSIDLPKKQYTNVYLNRSQFSGTAGTIIKNDEAAKKKAITDLVYNKSGENIYQLKSGSVAFNTGTEDIKDVEIPAYDAGYTDRVKDCAIDMGAYEFNGAAAISADVTSVSGQAIYYVTPDGYGSRTAANPENAACAAKLQAVLDAAGRYKYLNPEKQVIVKVANDWEMAHAAEPEDFTYYATRTTDQTDQDVRVWSIMVPRGVEVWGGYTDVPTKEVDGLLVKDTEKSWNNTYNGFNIRNITANPTYFDSYYVNKLEKTEANTYHVVTFTDRVFDTNGVPYLKDEESKVATGAASGYHETGGNDESIFLHMSGKVSGNVIMADATTPKNFGTAEKPQYASNRAVIDGIFVSGGQADAASGSSGTLNINSYGGAALVNDFAYVRNCILTGNSATNGGALALTDRALVSGCLIMDNVASNQGGGIYVFENGAKLSNGTTINTAAGTGQQMDLRMPHVFTSTIVANTAQQGGGIWFTSDVNSNARFNSVVVWQNEASDQANVFGMVNPEQPTEDETLSEIFYPFSFSLIENVRASGSNNLESMPLNREGVRFVNKTHDFGQSTVDQYDMAVEKETVGEDTFADFGYYGLTKYSMLCSTGMPNTYYNQLKESIAIADDDILGQPRIDTDEINNFIEIGARALPKRMPNKVLMLRLFVAHPDVVDTKTATQFMRLNEEASLDGAQKYYSQRGSSFAFPFNFLQDAIDYITRARNGQINGLMLMDGETEATADIVRNLPFEIVLGKGTYYPKQSLTGSTESVWAQTFAIPEGVTIIGGFNPEGGVSESDPTYYGRYYKADKTKAASTDAGDIYTNVAPIPKDDDEHRKTPGGAEVGRGNLFGTETVDLPLVGTAATPAVGTEGNPDYVPAKPASSDYMPERTVKFQQWHIQDIADRRGMIDNNKNGIIEPWEFANQTIISGNAVNGETDGVYHIMTAVADADAVGNLPKVQKYMPNLETKFTGYNSTTKEGDPALETGYQWKEMGQQIRLNGLIVTGGNALTYLSTALDDYGSYMFYHGAGLLVDGNHYKNSIDAPSAAHTDPVFHNSAAYGVGYRDIPVSVTNCQFRNNKAGYGGAISSNGSLTLFDSAFEQNMAIGQTEKPEEGEEWISWVGDQNHSGSGQKVTEVSYPGQGGAIHATNQLSAFNTLFANNEACLGDGETPTIELVKHPTFRVPVKDNASATLRAVGGAIMMGSAANHHIVNCDFVRNKANAYPAVFTMNPTVQQNTAMNAEVDTHDYSQIINTVAWGNEVNGISSNANYKTAAKLMVNIGKKNRTTQYITDKSKKDFYNPEFKNTAEDKVYEGVPTADDLIVADPEGTPAVSGTANAWQEAVWFCAYEEGVGFKPNNTNDLRESIIYSPKAYAPTMIKAANGGTRDGDGKITSLGSYQNCNILIVADNADVAGPNFGNPSVKAGFEGFTEGADWSPSRFNRLTDNGNGWIRQSVEATTLAVTFHNDDVSPFEGNKVNFQGAYPITHYISGLTPEKQFPEYKLWLPLGREAYMRATNDMEPDDQYINGTNIGKRHKNYPRISADPTVGVQKAYIDIGVYEYQKQPLARPGSEVDILWVSTQEHPENGPANGATWKTPTSDLQRAIETLLASRNGHKKEIRIMEGEYTPVTPHTVNDTKYNAFVIDTKSLNPSAYAPSSTDYTPKSEESYAQSLTIKGGYSSEIPYAYDPVKYKTTIRQDKAVDGVSTDYLFFVADPTVRYIRDDGYTEINKFGAIAKSATGEGKTPKAMPIQFDGITLINDKADKDVSGSAIYYPDFTATSEVDGAHSVSVGGSVVYYKNKTEFNKYDAQGKHIGEESTEETDFAVIVPDKTIPDVSDVKMIISKLQVVNSGNAADKVVTTGTVKYPSAVYVGKNGGSALIYNTVFHSNKAMPLDAWNTVNVNNTFGLNGSFARLQDVADPKDGNGDVIKTFTKSQMHNSALWKNNKIAKGSYGNQVLFGDEAPTASADKFSYNSYTGGPSTEDVGNTSLASDNSNIGEGPNFVDPENEDIELRNFDLKPSIRLLNKGNGLRWQEEDQDPKYPTDPSKKILVDKFSGTYADKVVTAHYDLALASTFDKDVLYRTRIVSKETDGKQRIDIGAYEFQGNLINVLYVDPNKPHDDAATGENWEKAFGYGDLQDAEDLAAIYHMSTLNEEAYVFVKGNSSTNTGKNTNETLTIRDGVTTYGSIISSYTDWHDILSDPSNPSSPKKYENIDAFIKDMTSQREGVASNAASKTIVTGIKTDKDATYDATPEVGGNTYDTPVVVDGFVVTDPNSPKTPVLDITNTSEEAVIVVRNVVVADNNTGSANVAQISNGLIYEALFRDNKTTGAALKVANYPEGVYNATNTKTRGFAVNVTVEGKTIGADYTTQNASSYVLPVDGKRNNVDVESATQIFKSITNSINSGSGKNAAGASAPYGAITNPGISGKFYNIADPNLNYQLTETSKYIDMCELDVDEETGHPIFLPAGQAKTETQPFIPNLRQFVHYTTDRDILGNPRLLTGVTTASKIDRGAFETWKVMNTIKGFQCGEDGTIASADGYEDDDHALIKKHFYPHDGSVVYVMNDHSLVIDAFNPEHEVKPTPENPGYLLVKEGASFYGNGRPVTAAYVAVERKVRKGGSIVAVPYAMNYEEKSSVAKVGTVVTAGHADLDLDEKTGRANKYSGDERMDWKYIFQTANTKCWDQISNAAANQGVLFEPHGQWYASGDDDNAEVTLRFTGKGTSLTDYIYTETTAASKAVTLTKYDDAESTNNGADYTDELDMGWNCFGIPYLVSEYKPYEKTSISGENYSMNIPHTLWLYYNGTQSPDGTTVNGDGGYYSVKAWKNTATDWHVSDTKDARLWVGEGIFTQTATLADTEALTFYRPVAPTSFTSLAKRGNVRYFYDATGVVEIDKDPAFGEDGYAVESTEYYTVNGMKIDKPRHGVVIIRETLTNGKVRTIKRTFK